MYGGIGMPALMLSRQSLTGLVCHARPAAVHNQRYGAPNFYFFRTLQLPPEVRPERLQRSTVDATFGSFVKALDKLTLYFILSFITPMIIFVAVCR